MVPQQPHAAVRQDRTRLEGLSIMTTARGRNLLDDLLYGADNHIWFKELGDGTVRIGMTAAATAMADKRVATPGFTNTDPYREGWPVVVRPEDRDSEKSVLLARTQVARPYEAKLSADGFAGCE
jgi:glycine cleavage system H protein